jgi:hypothetical protein
MLGILLAREFPTVGWEKSLQLSNVALDSLEICPNSHGNMQYGILSARFNWTGM